VKISYIKTLTSLAFLIFALLNAGTENIAGNEAWRILERATILFERQELGEALLSCEQAKARHAAEIGSFISILQNSMSPLEVKKAGDDIMTVYSVLEKRNDSSALEILNSVMLNHKAEFFGKSMQSLLAWLQRRLVYPEADFLLGQIYEAEGENSLALSYYEKSWQNKDFLDIPDERYTIAYRMADLSFHSDDRGAQEKYLLLILLDDKMFGKPGEESATLNAMIHTLNSDPTTEKFFSLYRHSNFKGLKAYQDLSALYYDSNNFDRALSVAALASCISVSLLSDAVKEYDFEYRYTDLSDLLIRAGKSAEITEWAGNIKIWDSFLLLASILQAKGEYRQARSIRTILAAYCPDTSVSRKATISSGKASP
jgi:hypothetical protein